MMTADDKTKVRNHRGNGWLDARVEVDGVEGLGRFMMAMHMALDRTTCTRFVEASRLAKALGADVPIALYGFEVPFRFIYTSAEGHEVLSWSSLRLVKKRAMQFSSSVDLSKTPTVRLSQVHALLKQAIATLKAVGKSGKEERS